MSRKKRKYAVRSTADEGFTLGELLGLPDASDELAINILTNGISTKTEAANYRKRQLEASSNAREAAAAREDKKAKPTDVIIAEVARARSDKQGYKFESKSQPADSIRDAVNKKISEDAGQPVSARHIRRHIPADAVKPRKDRR